jgi:hypothetical protein
MSFYSASCGVSSRPNRDRSIRGRFSETRSRSCVRFAPTHQDDVGIVLGGAAANVPCDRLHDFAFASCFADGGLTTRSPRR